LATCMVGTNLALLAGLGARTRLGVFASWSSAWTLIKARGGVPIYRGILLHHTKDRNAARRWRADSVGFFFF